MTLLNTDLFLVNRDGTSHRYSYADLRNDISVSGVTEQVIPESNEAVADQVNGFWSLADGPFWRFADTGQINFPQVTATEVNMSGLIRITGSVTSWGAGGFVFGENTEPPADAAEAIVPFYVQATNRILIGRATPNFA